MAQRYRSRVKKKKKTQTYSPGKRYVREERRSNQRCHVCAKREKEMVGTRRDDKGEEEFDLAGIGKQEEPENKETRTNNRCDQRKRTFFLACIVQISDAQ